MKNDTSIPKLENVNCDLCESNSYTHLFEGMDYRFGRKEKYSVVKCKNCGLIYINPRPTAESVLKLYEENYTPENNLKILPKIEKAKWKIVLKKIWHKINGQYVDEIISKAEGKVLDIGCSNGYLLLSLKQKGCEVYGVETNLKFVEICKEMGLEVFCGTVEDAKFPDESFDTIVMSQVLEHLPSPKTTLKEIFRVLKPKGKVLVYCPNPESYLSQLFGKYWHGWHIPFHFYTFTKETIGKFAIKTGFKIKKISKITPDNFFVVSLKSYFWGDKNDCKQTLYKGKFFDSVVFRMCISFVIRLLDIFLEGDCLKVELIKESE